ncbi:hypothetical protein CDL12_06523 [Handroanthus impetiginosus]|uniref:Uncharacterized protein n=1 Tax=Handroanthus impetiginosus TaxID=429701 RepID=A0A2G9HTE9_9LAMI|nr:hypothetical protein CDL12_06523 [Handroanthus impetiginosus]
MKKCLIHSDACPQEPERLPPKWRQPLPAVIIGPRQCLLVLKLWRMIMPDWRQCRWTMMMKPPLTMMIKHIRRSKAKAQNAKLAKLKLLKMPRRRQDHSLNSCKRLTWNHYLLMFPHTREQLWDPQVPLPVDISAQFVGFLLTIIACSAGCVSVRFDARISIMILVVSNLLLDFYIWKDAYAYFFCT